MNKCTKYDGEQFVINQQTRLRTDGCAIEVDQRESEGPGQYTLSNFHSCDCGAEKVREIAFQHPQMIVRDGYGWGSTGGCKIDDDSNARLGCKHTNPRLIQQLYQRPYLTVPYMGNGCHYPDKESCLRFSEQTGEKRSCNVLAGVSIDRNIPMIDCLKNNIQNPNNLIEETYGWIRGGESTRKNLKDIDYKGRCLPKKGIIDPNLGNNEV